MKDGTRGVEGSRWLALGQESHQPSGVTLLLGFGLEAAGLSLWLISSSEQTVGPHISTDPCGRWLKASFKNASYFSFGWL